MVALDDGGISGSRLDHVWVDGALDQVIHPADLLGLLLKDPDELLADDLPLVLRLRYPGQLDEEALLRVHADEVDVPLGEGGLHLVSLIFPHEAVVHKHAGELTAHRLGQQGRGYGGVHSAGQGQQHFPAADLLPDLSNGGPAVVLHSPVALGAAHLIEEVVDHVDAVLGVVDLGVELDPIEAPGLVRNGHIGAAVAVGGESEAVRHLGHVVPVAHPGDTLLRQALEEGRGGVVVGLGLAVFASGIVLGLGDLAAQGVGHELAAIADAQDGHSPGEDLRVHVGGGIQIHTVGAAGEDDADGVHGFQLGKGRGAGHDLAVHIALPDPAGDQLIVLAAEVQNDDGLMGHRLILSSVSRFYRNFTKLPLYPREKRSMLKADRGKGDDHMMQFQENSRIDLEDLLYDGQEPAVSER